MHSGAFCQCRLGLQRTVDGKRGARREFRSSAAIPDKGVRSGRQRDEVEADLVKMDRRILRTRDTLGEALVGLIREKPFDEITVQEILDRAGVERSTFYTHYRDKDDLFRAMWKTFLRCFLAR